jgi:hypothetical protein
LGGVSALAVHGADVYAGGSFSHVYDAGGSIPGTCYLAKWDGTHWSALGSDGAGGCSLNSSVLAVAVDSVGNVYAGGYFTNVKDASGTLDAADYIAKWDPVSGHWSALGGTAAGDGSLNARVFALAANGSDIYAGGSFTNVENPTGPVSAADYVAKWDGTQWSALGSNASGNGSVQGVVSAVVVNGSDVYVGGGFQNVSNPDGAVAEADFVARWDGSRWAALGGNGTGNGSLNGWVQAIAAIGNHVYVGGNFANVADNTTTLAAADHIARWDGTHWAALGSGTGGDGSIREPGNDVVYAIAISGELLYAGGYFFNVDNGGTVLPYADYIAAYGLPRYTISGNARVSGAVLQYTDGTAKTATAAANGAYSFTVPYYWSGTVTPAKTGCTFTPASKTYSNVLADKPGEDYSVNCTWTYQSTGSQDGWMLESGENTNVANKLDSAAVILFLGDDAAKRQYRAVLSFPTSSLPDTAVITKATLKLNRQTIIGGGNPFSIFQGLLIDMRKGYFGSNSKLQLVDFKAASSKVGLGPFNPTPSGTLYTITLPSKAWPYLNKLSTNGGLTQLRLRFKLDDNNNAVPNYIAFYSGNAASAKRPVLTVTFHVP